MSLGKLIKAVEAGKWDHDAAARWLWMKPGERYGWAHSAFHGSLDAALALHNAVLPEWAVERLVTWPGAPACVWLYGTHELDGERWHNPKDGKVSGTADTPARAWLLAILRALEAEAGR